MWSWLQNGKTYETVTSAALLIGFLSTVAMNYWPGFAISAAVVMVLATAVAVTVYFAARSREVCEVAEGEHTAGAQQEASVQQEAPANVGSSQTGADQSFISTEFYRNFEVVTTPEALREVSRATNTARLLKTYRSAVQGALWEKSAEHLFLHYISNVLADSMRLRNELVHSPYIFSKRSSIQRMVDIERFVQRLDRRQSEKLANPIIVKIGPVTVEITDEETRVHVESAKPVITNVSGARRPSGDDEMMRIEDAESRPVRVIH